MADKDFERLIDHAIAAQQRFRNRWEDFTKDDSLSVDGTVAQSILSELEARLQDNYPFFHPRYAGQMIKPPHPIAIAAYLMAMQINPNNHALDGGPATAKMELEAVAQLAEMFGYDRHIGHLTSSGTIANLEALWIAGSVHPGKQIAFSSNAHYTHKRMCDVLKIESRTIDLSDPGPVEHEFKQGTIGTVVVTIGTTGTGTVEPLHTILPLAKKYGVRVHADCAYGGFFMLLAKEKESIIDPAPFLTLKQCDSIVIDPHKHGLQPYGCGCVIFNDPGVGQYYKHDSPYTYFTSNDLHLGEISLECSRAGASAAALWATLKAFPLKSDTGLGMILKKTRRAALQWSQLISGDGYLREVGKPDLDIVIYHPKTEIYSASAISTASERIFSETMHRQDAPLYLAAFALDSAILKKMNPDFIGDKPITKVLRSVLMKPEHEKFVPDLFKEISDLAKIVQ